MTPESFPERTKILSLSIDFIQLLPLFLIPQQQEKRLCQGGEKLFVDYAGLTVPIVSKETGETAPAQIFVAVLGASNYTFAEASWTQGSVDFIGSQVRALQFFGGVPEMLVPDNLRSAVTKACRYDPQINRSYQHMAEHFGCSILPARPYKPKDKAKVEAGVQLVERWILMRLRHATFFSLSELNWEIRRLLEDLNNRAFKQLPGCRRSQFELLDGKQHQEQAYRACLGLLNLEREYGQQRLNAACDRAIKTGGRRVDNVRSILKSGLDKVPIELPQESDSERVTRSHENIRGAGFFQ